jgi:hypothetical protein
VYKVRDLFGIDYTWCNKPQTARPL